MDSSENNWSHVKRDEDDEIDLLDVRGTYGEQWELGENKKHRSIKSRKASNGDVEGLDSSRRRKSSRDANENRKRSGGKGGSDDGDDYGTRRETRSKHINKMQEESSLERLSNLYQDGELDNRQDVGEKVSSSGHGRSKESERRKTASELADTESMRSGTKRGGEQISDEDFDRTVDSDSKFLERCEGSREKCHGSSDLARTSRRRWDESDAVRKDDSSHERAERRSSRASDLNYDSTKERIASSKSELNESRFSDYDINLKRGIKTTSREDLKADVERTKYKGRSEVFQEGCTLGRDMTEDRLSRDQNDKHRRQRTPSAQDAAHSRVKHFGAEEHGNLLMVDGIAREMGGHSTRGTPERTGRHQLDCEHSEMEYDKSSDLKRKELERDIYKDDSSKRRDDSWSDRGRGREGYLVNWKRRQPGSMDKDLKSGDIVFDSGCEWEIPRHGWDRIDRERHHGRSGTRRDGSRGEAVKTSSNIGVSSENYDVIEIQTRPLDCTRADSASNFSRRGEELAYALEYRSRRTDASGFDVRNRLTDSEKTFRDQSNLRDDVDTQGGKVGGQGDDISSHSAGGQISGSILQPTYGREPISLIRAPQGLSGSRGGKGARARPTIGDNQQTEIPLPLIRPPCGPPGMALPGPGQPINPNITPAAGPPIPPGVFIPPFSPPVVWPGPRGGDMSLLSLPSGLPPVPPGPSGPRFPPNVGTPPNTAMYFNQSGLGRGVASNVSAPIFNASGPAGRGTPDKIPGGWVPSRNNGPSGKAPSRGEQNDYSQNFVDTGMRPQNFIRELELTNVEDYPKLRELIQRKDEIVANSATPPMYLKCDLKEFELSPEFFGTKFDVILVDPPWEEYVHRAPGVADHREYWTFEEILNLRIEAIADTPSFIFLWVGDGVGLEQGRQCLKKWGFRRCEDICWVKTNKTNATRGLRRDSQTLFQHSKEHCLMGIKGTVRRSIDGHVIHANIDTDVIIAEEPPDGSTRKPEDMYRIVEHFALGRRRLELFGEDHNIRAGWLTVGKGLSSSNFNAEAYIRNFGDKDGKVWQGGGGRNPPPGASHLLLTTPEIEALRPKSPMKNQQQSSSISLTSGNFSYRRPAGNSPQNPTDIISNQETSSSNPSAPGPWASPLEGFKGREGNNLPLEDKVFDMYGYSGQAQVDYMDFETQRAMNFL